MSDPLSPVISDARRRARAYFDAAEFDKGRETALQGLSEAPDDVELLVLAGRAGVEVDADDAVELLRRATAVAPENALAWHHLGEALAAEGSTHEAEAAFRRAVELDPEDQVALTHLGHTALAAGRNDEGVGYLARAADIAHAPSSATISLVDMYRSFEQYDEALDHARRVSEAAPDDILSWLDVGELSLQVGRLDEARGAFERLRELDDVPGHEAYPVHGMTLVEIRRGHWKAAWDLAAQAAAIDPRGLGTEIAAFLSEKTGGPREESAPTQAEVDAALTASFVRYRQMLADNRRLSGVDLLG